MSLEGQVGINEVKDREVLRTEHKVGRAKPLRLKRVGLLNRPYCLEHGALVTRDETEVRS